MWTFKCKCGGSTFNLIDKSGFSNGVYLIHKVARCTGCGEETDIVSYPRDTVFPTTFPPTVNKGNSWKSEEKCAFDGLAPGTYGLVCNCSRCSPKCRS